MFKKGFQKWMLIVCLCQHTAIECFAQQTVLVSNYFAKQGDNKNVANAITKAIAVCKTKKKSTLLLPGGRIDIWPEKNNQRELYISNCSENDTLSKKKDIAFLFEDCKNITLDGNNTLVVLHGIMISFAIINSSNISIHNIRFDYERPTMSEMKVKAASADSIKVVIHPDSKYYIDSTGLWFYGDGWKTRGVHAIVLDSQKNTMRGFSFIPFLKSAINETEHGSVLFKGNFKDLHFTPGDIITVRDIYRNNCGALISLSKNISLQNIQMNYMHGLGIVSQFSENISLSKVIVAPAINSGRVISSWADCFHFSGCKGKISLDSCVTSGSHDDAINIHGTQLQIVGVSAANRIKVRFMHHQTFGFKAFFAGDSIAFINPRTLLSEGKSKLKRAILINPFEMELETENNLPVAESIGYCVDNLSWYPEVSIKNCRFERIPTRGILITTNKKSVIEKNVFFNTGMAPILIADDASSWYESGPVTDILIRNNLFEYNNISGGGTITIAPENKESVDGKSVHHNIRIIKNDFRIDNGTVLSAKSTDGLIFNDNKIVQTGITKTNTGKPVIALTACKNVQIENNSTDLKRPPSIQINKMKRNDIKTDFLIEVK